MDDIVNPQDAELEEIVLGACLRESTAITLVAGILRPEVFYIEKNREIYAALQSMYRAGQVIDLMTVKEELTRRGKLDFIGGPYALVSITTRVASSAHLEYHARILQQKYIRREAILGFHKLLAQAADETTDIADTLADAHTLLDQLEKECGMSEHLRSMLQLMEDTVGDTCRLEQERSYRLADGIQRAEPPDVRLATGRPDNRRCPSVGGKDGFCAASGTCRRFRRLSHCRVQSRNARGTLGRPLAAGGYEGGFSRPLAERGAYSVRTPGGP